ncbi:uracil-DNA glycosylase [Aquisphaera insulae]|uniref:uracil-DNA glycosylase n=1 Tax=Aquisphaera insulae TaxID=2712864 RepID=UPI002030BEF0|nr:uracil-DNA glycosylase [Aquisphaera insulae]
MQSDPEHLSDADAADAVRIMVKEVRQRLESLLRAGVKEVPFAPVFARRAPGARTASGPDAAGFAAEGDPGTILPAAPSSPAPAIPQPTVAPRPEGRPAPARPAAPAAATAPAASFFQESGFDSPALAAAERLVVLKDLAEEAAGCRKCPELVAYRTRTVFADGDPNARLMFIGEAPGADEDRTGRPFVGKAGQLLTDMITKGMGLKRDEVYIANILKCRPPENRPPQPEESANCIHFLERQIEVVRPEFLCLLGRTAAVGVLKTGLSMGRLRGKWYRYRGIPTIATYHPSYLLRTPSAKKEAWEDLQLLMTAMGLRIPPRKKDQD